MQFYFAVTTATFIALLAIVAHEQWILGFVSFEIERLYYTWADKIVYDPKMEGGAK